MTKILVINGSYREAGITDQSVSVMVQFLRDAGSDVEVIELRHYPIEFCMNCRHCTQLPGEDPGECVHDDAMQDLVDKIEQADGYILASPTNLGSVTAIFKRFMERLVVYAYWPWSANGPVYRKTDKPKKRAVLISSCAAPGLIGRWLYGTHKQLNMTAKIIGAETVGTLFTGLIAQSSNQQLSEKHRMKARALASLLSN